MSMMEIYNEAVYDLLGADNAKDSRQSPPGGSTRTSLDIRQNAAGGTSVPGLTEVCTNLYVYIYVVVFANCKPSVGSSFALAARRAGTLGRGGTVDRSTRAPHSCF